MKTTMLEPMLREATIKAIDGVAKKLTDAESFADKKVGKLLVHWNEMERDDKEHVVGIAIAGVTMAVTALVAMRQKAKSPIKTAAKKMVKKVVKKL